MSHGPHSYDNIVPDYPVPDPAEVIRPEVAADRVARHRLRRAPPLFPANGDPQAPTSRFAPGPALHVFE